MARIQILELPARVLGDAVETPFAFVIDQTTSADLGHADLSGFLENTGAVSVLIVPGTLDIPANNFSATPSE